jgi:hypothetical protein
MMFSVSHVCGRRCRIVDENQKPVFIGTWQAAEEWLDYLENRASHPARAPLSRVVHAIAALTRQIFDGAS